MFCDISRESPTIDEEIDAALDFLTGKITSHDSIQNLNPSEESVRNGKIVFFDNSPSIRGIKTDNQEVYESILLALKVSKNNPDGFSPDSKSYV
ncbi:MAG: DUF5104 domain-containing protein [Clostridiales bacterium]|nr:DUF5104 domain-containing protein [Clostridiaceae bacterium]NLX83973.1 DUF5104 domain-containing protein [Clostridiales bacterium]